MFSPESMTKLEDLTVGRNFEEMEFMKVLFCRGFWA